MPVKPAYQGEAQLVRWAESAAAGRTVTLRIDEDDVQHAFKGLKCGDQGQRLHVVVMLVDDNEELQDPEAAKTKSNSPQAAGGRARAAVLTDDRRSEIAQKAANTRWGNDQKPLRSNLAAIKCKEDEAFGIWIAETYPTIWDRHYIDGKMLTPEAADATIKEVLNITSKRELDTDAAAGERFDRMMTSFQYRGRA